MYVVSMHSLYMYMHLGENIIKSICKQLFNVTSDNEEGPVLELFFGLTCDFHLERQMKIVYMYMTVYG